MSLSTELSKLTTEAQNEVTVLERDAKTIWARGELYVIAGACLFVGLLIGHFAR